MVFMADAFISYAREDIKLAEQLEQFLSKRGKEIWRDERSIPPTVPFPQEIERGIIETNAFIFIISRDSITSDWCLRELEIAVENGKRLIPLNYRELKGERIPEVLRDLNWIDLRDPDNYEEKIEQVLYVLNTDFAHVKYHTWLQRRAKDWESRQRSGSTTLRGKELEEAESWLALERKIDPKATTIQREYILASRRDSTVRQRRILTGVFIALIVAIALGITAYTQFLSAQNREQARATQQAIAEEQRDIAVARRLAAQARNLIQDNPPLALILALEAQAIVKTDEATQVIAELPYYYPPQANILQAHNAQVNSVSWSPDGSRFATGSDDHTIIIWDGNSEQPLTALKGPDGPVTGLVWSPDGSHLASLYDPKSIDNPIIIWDVINGQPSVVLTATNGLDGINNIDWSSNGTKIAAVTAYNSLVWDLNHKEIISRLMGHLVGLAAASDIIDVSFSPDGSRLASSGDDRVVLIWDLAENKPIISLEGAHTSSITTIKWSPDGSKLASGSGQHSFPGDNTIVLWDLNKSRGTTIVEGNTEVVLGEPIATLRGHSGGVNSLDWSSDGKMLASGSDDGTIILWDPINGKRLATLTGHVDRINSVAFNPAGTKIVSASADNNVIVWDITQDQLAKSLEGHSGEITSLVWSSDGNRLASGSADASIVIWDVDNDQAIQALQGHRLPILGLAWSPDGSYLVSGTRDRSPYGSNVVWDVRSGDIVALSYTDASGCGAVGWSPNGESWVESSGWGVASWVATWDLENQQYAIPPQERFGCAYGMDFNPYGSILALGNHEGNIFIWDMMRPNSVITLTGQVEGISDVSWSPDGSRVAVAGTDQVLVFDVNSTLPILTLDGHTSVDWSQDGTKLLSPGAGNMAEVWDSASGQLITKLAGHTETVSHVAISPDGNQVATGGADRVIHVVSTRYIQPPCNWALRNTNLDEWQQYFPGETYRRTCPELPDGT